VLLLNVCLLLWFLLFNSLSTQSENFWIHPCIVFCASFLKGTKLCMTDNQVSFSQRTKLSTCLCICILNLFRISFNTALLVSECAEFTQTYTRICNMFGYDLLEFSVSIFAWIWMLSAPSSDPSSYHLLAAFLLTIYCSVPSTPSVQSLQLNKHWTQMFEHYYYTLLCCTCSDCSTAHNRRTFKVTPAPY
jgi:hypothetical protein